MHEMSLEKMVSEGCLKMIIIEGLSKTKIYRRVVHTKISIVGDSPIDIHPRVVHK